MTALEYRLAAALIRRMWQRGMISEEQYLCAYTFLDQEQAKEN